MNFFYYFDHFGQGHSCGQINTETPKGGKKRIIVVGGKNAKGYLKEVEILDEDQKTWKFGPELSIGISQAGLVEDANGGVVLVGGDSGTGSSLNSIYRLTHFDKSAAWSLMTQKLTTGRYGHVAYLIPDEITDCKEV